MRGKKAVSNTPSRRLRSPPRRRRFGVTGRGSPGVGDSPGGAYSDGSTTQTRISAVVFLDSAIGTL